MRTKRILSALLAGLLLVGALTACATGDVTDDTTRAQSSEASDGSETELRDNLPDDLNYGNDEITFLSRDRDGWTDREIWVDGINGEPINDVFLEGPVCREPVYRRTPLGREICDVMLAIPRLYHRADHIPCILWGRTAQQFSCFHTSDYVQIHGRLQSRQYTKLTEDGPLQKIAYEVSALSGDFISSPQTHADL